MNEFSLLCLFLLDVAMVAIAGWLALCAVRGETTGKLEPLLGWGLMMLFVVAGSGVALGLTASLGRNGFFIAHAALLLILFALRRHCWRTDLGAARLWLADLRQFLAEPNWLSRSAAALLLLMLALAAIAAAAEPRIHDTLAYRLPRIGLWLQESRIFHFETIDPRLNYMPWVPDLITAWLLGASSEGWKLVALTQTFGGALLLVATIALARQAGLTRGPALGAAALVLSLANVAVQFTTPQTDLVTAGLLSASFALWQGSFLQGRSSVLAGVGFALALGSKGTVFYIAPGLAIIVAYQLVKHRNSWTALWRTSTGTAIGMMVLVAPAYLMNAATYGSVFGPDDAIRLHHGDSHLGISDRAEKLWLNLRSSAIQLFDPSSQPIGLRKGAMKAGAALLEKLPQSDEEPYAFANYNRRYSLQNILNFMSPDADVLSCGLLAALAFVLACGTLAWPARLRGERALPLAGATAVVTYLLFQHAVVQWHPWTFRFLALAAPWWAVTVAAGFEAWPRGVRIAGWCIMLSAGASVFWHVNLRTPQAGWLALTQPPLPYDVYQGLRRWAGSLTPLGVPLTVALDANRPLAAFFRQDVSRHVQLRKPVTDKFATAESLVSETDGWLIAPLKQFQGREGRVFASSIIFFGPLAGNSVAAYRRLGKDEEPTPVLYRNQRMDTTQRVRRSLLIRIWDDAHVPLQFFNPRSESCDWQIEASDHKYHGTLSANGNTETVIHLPQNSLSEVIVTFNCPPGGPAPAVALKPEIAAP